MNERQHITLQVGSDFKLEPVRANFPDQQQNKFEIISWEPANSPTVNEMHATEQASVMAQTLARPVHVNASAPAWVLVAICLVAALVIIARVVIKRNAKERQCKN